MAADSAYISDGTSDFSGGIDSIKVGTVVGPDNPNGLTRQQLGWLINGTVRDGGIAPRDGFVYRGSVSAALPQLSGLTFQGKTTYVPSTGNPYEIWVIGGHVIKVDPTFSTSPQDLSAIYGYHFIYSGTPPKVYFTQGNQFLIIQAGDYNPDIGTGQLPLFWNGVTLSQSNGITGNQSGYSLPTEYSISTSAAWTVPAVGSGVVLSLNTEFLVGDLYDVLNLYYSLGTIQQFLGQFRITAWTTVAPFTVTLTALSLSGVGQGYAGGTVSTVLTGVVSIPIASPEIVTLSNIVQELGTPTAFSNPYIGGTSTWTFGAGFSDLGIKVGSYFTVYGSSSFAPLGFVQVVSMSGSKNQIWGVTWIEVIGPPFTTLMPSDIFATVLSNASPIFDLGTPTTVVNNSPGAGEQTWTFGNGFNAVGVVATGNGNTGTGTQINVYNSAGALLMNVTVLTQTGTNLKTWTVSENFVTGSPLPTSGVDIRIQVVKYLSGITYDAGVNNFIVPPLPDYESGLPFSGYWPGNEGSQLTLPIGGLYIGSVGDVISIAGNGITGGTLVPINFGQFTVVSFDGANVVLTPLIPPNSPSTYVVPYDGQAILGNINNQLVLSFISARLTGVGLGNQIPAALAMVYYMGRIWYAQGATISAGDISGGTSGTLLYGFLDSVLYVTENKLCYGGDGFTMPSGNDPITALFVPQMINASLGSGLLMIGTQNAIFSLQVPVSRTDWSSATSDNQPQINIVQLSNGPVNDWCVVSVNGDDWYQSNAPDIRSLVTAVRYFQQWGNVSLSSNEETILSKVNRSLMGMISGIYFDNRLLQLSLPVQTPYGIVHNAVIPLDMTTISTLEQQDAPNWEGHYEGLQILQLTTTQFGYQQRAFAAVLSIVNAGMFEVWELVPGQQGENNGTQINRNAMQATLPGFDFGKLFELKELVGGELWLDKILGVVQVKIEYSPDGSGCWMPWYQFVTCSAGDSSQLPIPQTYPLIAYSPAVRKPIHLPKPPYACAGGNARPSAIAYEFQLRLTITGQARVRGVRIQGTARDQSIYKGISQ